jgi:hypothetical protein
MVAEMAGRMGIGSRPHPWIRGDGGKSPQKNEIFFGEGVKKGRRAERRGKNLE